MGAAICAGVGIGIFADYSVAEKWNMVQSYQIPKQQNVQLYEELYRVFNKSYESLKDVLENWEPLEETTRIINNI